MTHEIVQTLDHLAESTRVLEQLRRFPRDRVAQLVSILEDPAAVESLLRLLRTVQELDRENRLQQMGPALPFVAANSEQTPVSASARDLSRDMPVMLEQLFSDRARFPTPRSISEFVEDTFRIVVPYQRSGRERYIKKIVRAVSRSPKALHHARSRLMHSESTGHDQAYSALYNFIRGRLTD